MESSGTQNLTIMIKSEKDMSNHPVLPIILSTSPRWNGLLVSLPFSALRIFNNVCSLSALISLDVYLNGEPDTEPITMIEAFRFPPQLRASRPIERIGQSVFIFRRTNSPKLRYRGTICSPSQSCKKLSCNWKGKGCRALLQRWYLTFRVWTYLDMIYDTKYNVLVEPRSIFSTGQ